jgi:hypothetical protein
VEIIVTLIAAIIAGTIGGVIDTDLHLTNTPMMGIVIVFSIGLYIMLDLILQNLAQLFIGGAS